MVLRPSESSQKKPLLLSFSDSYLATFGSAGKKKCSEGVCFDWSCCERCSPTQGCVPHCKQLEAIPFDQIGGLVFEPGSSSGTVKFPPRKLIKVLERLIKDTGGLIMANEITTGMGRTGAWFGYEHYSLHPDVIAIGKGLGNGYPVNAVAIGHDA
ncbi:MAG: aminotransferase class III-fold pyridoxal phosphate-dependent enzyme [Candidatus Riflebacteria bacterium]|nr:aminotransferase class III-fold pyridoxal phosphate-dependent enzyme [Candidatus Riflebacteria bacterium]